MIKSIAKFRQYTGIRLWFIWLYSLFIRLQMTSGPRRFSLGTTWAYSGSAPRCSQTRAPPRRGPSPASWGSSPWALTSCERGDMTLASDWSMTLRVLIADWLMFQETSRKEIPEICSQEIIQEKTIFLTDRSFYVNTPSSHWLKTRWSLDYSSPLHIKRAFSTRQEVDWWIYWVLSKNSIMTDELVWMRV